jgi:hypothetical protein
MDPRRVAEIIRLTQWAKSKGWKASKAKFREGWWKGGVRCRTLQDVVEYEADKAAEIQEALTAPE